MAIKLTQFKKGMTPHNKGKRKYSNIDIWEEMYLKEKKSTCKIGKELGIDPAMIYKRLKEEGVEIRNRVEALKYNKTSKLTQFKKGQIPPNKGKTKENYEPLKKAGKKRQRQDINKQKDYIIDLYVNKKISQYKISKIVGCDFVIINRILKENKIKIKPQSFYVAGKKSPQKGKTYEQLYGEEKAKRLLEEMRKRNLGKTYEEMYGEDRAKRINKKKQRQDINKQKDYIIGLYENGKITQSEIAKTLGCSITIINRILKENKIKINPLSFYTTGRESPRKGKAFEEFFGAEKAKEISKKMSKALKDDKGSRKGKTFEEYYGKNKAKVLIKKMSNAHKGRKNPQRGKTYEEIYGAEKAKEISEKLSKARKGVESFNKGKTYEELYGKERAKKAKEKLVKARSKRVLPVKDTSIEVKVQNFLKQLGIEFATHQYMKIKYAYQCDVFIPKQIRILQDGSIIEIKQKTVIECDGDYWHGNLEIFPINKMNQKIKEKRCLDYERTAQLEEAGYKVIRLWEHEIKEITLKDFKNKLNCPIKEK